MSKLQAIESKLTALNEYKFQELCDSFLAIRNKNYTAFSRLGSVSGKEKTRKGTPDSVILLPNGKYLFVEYSTNLTEGVKKLKKDVTKCLDVEKTQIPLKEISEIILCVNFNLNPSEIQDLRTLLKETHIALTLVTLDSLALDLHLNHRDLAHIYLDLPLDNGQIVSLEEFVNQYNAKANKIASPLDNDFLFREKEMAELKQVINSTGFVILTGPPGVGKTRLAIETIKQFLKEKPSFNAYCISYKNHDLLDDLFLYFKPADDNIIFVDDANRIDAFSQIIGFYNSPRTGSLKIVVTVRDYAYQEIERLCSEFNPRRIDLSKFDDEQITELIKAEPFRITNQEFHKPILNISDGNLRLAIMSARLAKKTRSLGALSDVSDLFDEYFSTFAKDKNEFLNELNIKCLAIIAFFYTIPYKDRQVTEPILKNFDIQYADFVGAIDKLDKLELVDVQFEHVKISEQNLSTYFFYKAFIKESLLSFEKLLSTYFDSNQVRFNDCVIPANNLFGPSKVMEKLRPNLITHLSGQKDFAHAYNFISTFWFYLQTETLEFIYSQIKLLPVQKDIKFKMHEDERPGWKKDEIIKLLSEFFGIPHQPPKQALELSFDYLKRRPELFTELIHTIRSEFAFDLIDIDFDFERQGGLIDLLADGVERDDYLRTSIFLEVCKALLQHNFRHTKGGRNRMIQIYSFWLPISELKIKEIRSKIWKTLDLAFKKYPSESFNTLAKSAGPTPDVSRETMDFDIPYIIGLVRTNLSADSFLHCRYVHDQIRWFRKNSIENLAFEELKSEFNSLLYQTFLKVDWNTLRDKEIFDFKNYDEYDKLKEQEIRSSFKFKTVDEIKDFYRNFAYLKSQAKNDWNYNRTIELVADENCSYSLDFGFELLRVIIEDNNSIRYVPRLVFKNHLVTLRNSKAFWDIIEPSSFFGKIEWKISYFEQLHRDLIDPKHGDLILLTFNEVHTSLTIFLERLRSFLKVCPKLFEDILKIVVSKNQKEDLRIALWMDFFDKNFEVLGDDIELIKTAYLQQLKIQNHFDYEGKGFLKILQKDKKFIMQYVQFLYSEYSYISRHERDLGFVWTVEGIETYLTEVFDFVSSKEPYFGISDHFCNSFYKKIGDEVLPKADDFLFRYMKDNYGNADKINVVIDIIRQSRKELFERALLCYISLNYDKESFSKIWWRGNGNVAVGDVIFGDLEAADWKNIQLIVEKSKVGIDLIPIKKYINDQIDYALRSGDWERKRRFLERY